MPGDVLVANEEGVHVVRGGEVVAMPVTSAVGPAFADGTGGLVLVASDLRAIWRVTPDGTATVLYESDPIEDVRGIWPYQVAVIPAVSPAPSLLFTRREAGSQESDPFGRDHVWVLPLDGESEAIEIPVETPGEGGVTGLGWQDVSGRLLMAMQSDGGGWLSGWSIDGTPSNWSTNPVPQGTPCRDDESYNHCFQSVTVVPGTTLIVYTWTNVSQTQLTMTVFDTASGSELTSVQIAEGAERSLLLHASRDTIVISRHTYDFQEAFTLLPVMVFDLATESLSELSIAGVATIVS